MDESGEEVELTEEVVLQLGNQILAVLGADEPITDLEPFTTDALYIQLFKALFPHLPLDELEPGENFEEMADNLRTLRELLGQSILETDLSYISATAILNGDLSHLSEFLQILMQVIALLAEGEGEGDEDQSSKQSPDARRSETEENKTDTRKQNVGLGLSSPDDDKDEHDLEEQIMRQINQAEHVEDDDSPSKDVPIVHDEPFEDDKHYSPDDMSDESPQESPESQFKQPKKEEPKREEKKAEVDVLHDPLLPDFDDMRKSSGKKRQRAGSFGDKEKPRGFEEDEDDEDAIAYDELDPDEKLAVLQQLYEEYNRDPDNFPEEQRVLLEEELKNMIDKGLIDGFDEEEEESEVDERMKVKGEINFPKEPLPIKTDDEDREGIDKGGQELDVKEVGYTLHCAFNSTVLYVFLKRNINKGVTILKS